MGVLHEERFGGSGRMRERWSGDGSETGSVTNEEGNQNHRPVLVAASRWPDKENTFHPAWI